MPCPFGLEREIYLKCAEEMNGRQPDDTPLDVQFWIDLLPHIIEFFQSMFV